MLNQNEKLNVEVEMMSLEELDQVSGGTVGEFEDIMKAFSKYDTLKTISGVLKQKSISDSWERASAQRKINIQQ